LLQAVEAARHAQQELQSVLADAAAARRDAERARGAAAALAAEGRAAAAADAAAAAEVAAARRELRRLTEEAAAARAAAHAHVRPAHATLAARTRACDLPALPRWCVVQRPGRGKCQHHAQPKSQLF